VALDPRHHKLLAFRVRNKIANGQVCRSRKHAVVGAALRVIAERCLLLLCGGVAPECSTPCLMPGGRVIGAAVDDFLMCVLLWELGAC
jgi:hypothetical protein